MAKKRIENIGEAVERMLAGDRRSAARLITAVEDQAENSTEIMKLVYPHSGNSTVIGLTGSGGSGKSSLIDLLIRKFRVQGRRVGVVAVDPSSPFSGGALLGDRIRFQSHSIDDGVYIRSMGSRNCLGGLARATNDVVRIMEAMGQDIVIVETLGTGQDEIDIIHLARTCILVLTPGMGDDIQAMKAGIMEIADIIVLNKADLDSAESCLRSLEATVHYGLGDGDKWVPRVIPTVAMAPTQSELRGIDELVETIEDHTNYLHESATLDQARAGRVEQELALVFKDEVEKSIFKGLKGTGKKRAYIRAILDGKTNPYEVVEEVLRAFLKVE
jgi:LAO/AO transport system kinase